MQSSLILAGPDKSMTERDVTDKDAREQAPAPRVTYRR